MIRNKRSYRNDLLLAGAMVIAGLASVRSKQRRLEEAIELYQTASRMCRNSGWLPAAEKLSRNAERLQAQFE